MRVKVRWLDLSIHCVMYWENTNKRMRRTSRKDTIQKLVDKGVLSADGARALILALDPFHDTNITPIGIPDTRTDPSVVQVVKETIQVSAPTGTTANWDVHICTLPERCFYTGGDATAPLLAFVETGAQDQYGTLFPSGGYVAGNIPDIAPLVVNAVPSGQPTFPVVSGGFAPTAPVNMTSINLNNYVAGNSRVISSAFEVHNTTAELYKQGTVTVYRLPQPLENSTGGAANHLDISNSYSVGPVSQYISRLPPGTPSAALLLPDSKQWEAAYGAYCVDTYDHEHNAPDTGVYGARAFVLGDNAPPEAGTGVTGFNALPALFGGASARQYQLNYEALSEIAVVAQGVGLLWKPIHRNTSGAYFTGLSPQSTLTVTFHTIIETFPTQPNPLVTLARPTPDYDPMFFALYKEAARMLPPGVMVGENASGDFWDTCLGIIGDIAPVIGNMIPLPGLGSLGQVAGAAAKSAQAARNKQKSGSSGANENKFVNDQPPKSQTPKKPQPGKKGKGKSKGSIEMM